MITQTKTPRRKRNLKAYAAHARKMLRKGKERAERYAQFKAGEFFPCRIRPLVGIGQKKVLGGFYR